MIYSKLKYLPSVHNNKDPFREISSFLVNLHQLIHELSTHLCEKELARCILRCKIEAKVDIKGLV